jgi:serine/threonine-protein kinase
VKNGSIINQYKIISAIGKGGMGEVFLAQDSKLDRKVALKILPAEFAEDQDRMRRFIREAKSASALNHPNIITIYEIGESNGTHYIATEFIDGKTLRQHLKSADFSRSSVLELAIQIASALQIAHSAGIIHRDVKPDNVMIRKDGLVKILDFGLAKLAESPASTPALNHGEEEVTAIQSPSTSPGLIVGTATYMSPEQAKGQAVDARTDIFSFGILFYELLTGTLPFSGETALETISSILRDEPPPLRQSRPDLPNEIERIVSKSLRKDPDERYQTAKDLLIDLKAAKRDVESQHQSKRGTVPPHENDKTQILKAPTTDEVDQKTTDLTLAGNPKGRYVAAGILALLLAVGGFFGYQYFASNKQINSIAVLPFENKSSKADSEYLSDGLAESLIYRLSQLPNLKVSPTSSVFRYKGKATDPQTIAEELGVDSVMTGRITQRGDNLTISVELVDTRNNKSLWGEQYERKLSELLATQREITSEITNKLQLKLSGESEQKLAKKYTDNDEAFQLYLKGRFHFAKRTKEDILKGIEYFQQAIKLDPNFALAYASIAESYNAIPSYPYLSPKEAFPQAQAAAARALEIDPNLSEAHSALGAYFATYDWNWAEAEREHKRAIELSPNASVAHYRYGQYLAITGRKDESIAEVKRAVELEPLSLITGANLAATYLFAGQNEQGLEQARKTYDLEPNFVSGRFFLGVAYNANGRYVEAITISEKSLQTHPKNQLMLFIAGYAYAKSGRRQEAEEVVNRFREIEKTQYVMSCFIASIYGALGEKDNAFAELEKAFANRDWELCRLQVAPYWNPLRDDPRFKDLLKRMNLPE